MALTQEIIELLKTQTYIPFVGAGASVPVRLKGEDKAAFPDWTGLVRDLLALVVEKKGGPKLRGDVDYRGAEVSEIFRVIRHAVEKGHYKAKGTWPKTWAEIDMAVKERAKEEAKKSDGHAGEQSLKEDDDYLKILDWAQSKTPISAWRSHLERIFGHMPEAFDRDSLTLNQAIWALGSPAVLTTNYDAVLEASCQRDDLNVISFGDSRTRDKWVRNALETPMLWHLHGRGKHAKDLILGYESYEALYGKAFKGQDGLYPSELEHLKDVCSAHRFLFVGFSLTDPGILEVLTYLRQIYPSTSPHLLLCVDRGENDAERRTHRQKTCDRLLALNVKPIFYPDHGQPLLDCLREATPIMHAQWIQTKWGKRVIEGDPRNTAPKGVIQNLAAVADAQDGVLIVNTFADDTHPLGTQAWTRKMNGPKFNIPTGTWNYEKRKDNWSRKDWQCMLHQVDETCKGLAQSLTHGSPKALHIVATCPQPLGLYLGMKLKRHYSGRPLVIYQREPNKGEFEAFYWQHHRWARSNPVSQRRAEQASLGACSAKNGSNGNAAGSDVERFFNDRQIPIHPPQNQAPQHILLTIETGTPISPEQKQRLIQQSAADLVLHLRPKPLREEKGFLPHSTQIVLPHLLDATSRLSAIQEVANLLLEIGREYPQARVHVASPAPVGFLIALGYQLEPSTLGLNSLFYWDFMSNTYYPTLDLCAETYIGDIGR